MGLEAVPVGLPDLPYDALMNTLDAEAAAMFEGLTLDDHDDSLTWQVDAPGPIPFARRGSCRRWIMSSLTGCAIG